MIPRRFFGYRFCVGDRFYLWDNKILCEYDYEERLVFSNIPYSGGGNQPVTISGPPPAGPGPGPGPGGSSHPGPGSSGNMPQQQQQQSFQQQLMNHLNDVKSPLQMNGPVGGGQQFYGTPNQQQVYSITSI
jgi:hypothetical protein